MSLSPAPLSLLIKAAPILTEEMYGDIQPAAWELLLSVDEHMAGAAGKGTKSVSVASQTDQLTAGHRALQDSFLVEEVLMTPRVSWWLFGFHRPHTFVLCIKEVVGRKTEGRQSAQPWLWSMIREIILVICVSRVSRQRKQWYNLARVYWSIWYVVSWKLFVPFESWCKNWEMEWKWNCHSYFCCAERKILLLHGNSSVS